MSSVSKKQKQTTLDSVCNQPPQGKTKVVVWDNRKVVIEELSAKAKEDALALEIGFRLLPSKKVFSKVTLNLYFEEHLLYSAGMKIPKSPLLGDDFALTPVLDMKGIAAGSYKIKVEMYQPWATTERIAYASKELTVDYVPVKKEDRYIKVPFVKSVVGANVELVSKDEKELYREISESIKREIESKRDEW